LVEQRIRNARVGGSIPLPGTKESLSIWLRLFAALPLPLLYGLARLLAFLAFRVFPYRAHVVRENLSYPFADWDEDTRRRVMRDYYRGFADMLVEIVKSARISPAELRRRVTIANLDVVQAELARGKPVLVLAGHQCNWEWMLLALSVELGYPLDAAYKPLVDGWAEREMLKLRSRFGARLVPANNLLGDIIQRRAVVRAVAMVADQEPVTSERKHWLKFLGRDSAFFLGPEEIARTTRYAAYFISMRRTARGCYEMRLELLAAAGAALAPGEFTTRYAQLVEAQIRAAPADWPWSHKRWKLKKPLY
jgi:KDO2-lipid IV(A) lauroyltransferase